MYPKALPRHGIVAELPDKDDRELITKIIIDELVSEIFTEKSRITFSQIFSKLARRGYDSVALACTEIPLLIDDDSSPLPTLDSTRLLARAAFDVTVDKREMPTWRGAPFLG